MLSSLLWKSHQDCGQLLRNRRVISIVMIYELAGFHLSRRGCAGGGKFWSWAGSVGEFFCSLTLWTKRTKVPLTIWTQSQQIGGGLYMELLKFSYEIFPRKVFLSQLAFWAGVQYQRVKYVLCGFWGPASDKVITLEILWSFYSIELALRCCHKQRLRIRTEHWHSTISDFPFLSDIQELSTSKLKCYWIFADNFFADTPFLLKFPRRYRKETGFQGWVLIWQNEERYKHLLLKCLRRYRKEARFQGGVLFWQNEERKRPSLKFCHRGSCRIPS